MKTPLRILLATALVVVCGWLFVVWNPGAESPGIALGAENDALTSNQREVAVATREQAAAPERTSARPRLAVVSADRGAPLPEASLTWLRRADTTPMWSANPDQRADADGRIELEHPAGDGWLPLVRAPGHVPQFVDATPDASGTIEVRMQPAARLEVSVLEERGAPVAGAAVVLTDRPLDAFGDLAATGIGHPLARHPRWQAVTDHAGRAVIDEIPPGTLVLNVLHEIMFPVDATAWNASLDLVAGPRRIVATLAEAEAVVFAVPSKAEVESVDWRVDLLRLRLEPMVTQRLALVRGWLDRKFPGALTYVHKRAFGDDRELLVRCQAVLADRTRWAGAWPLLRVRQIATPVYLEQQLAPGKTIVVRLRDKAGRDYPGIPIVVAAVDGSTRMRAATGAEVEVPTGRYVVHTTGPQPGVHQAFEDFTFEVGESPPYEFCATLEQVVTEVRVEVVYPSDEVLSPLEFYFANESRGPVVIVNWRPSRGPIRQWMTGKEVSLQVRSVAYADVDLGPVPLDPEMPAVLKVELKKKQNK